MPEIGAFRSRIVRRGDGQHRSIHSRTNDVENGTNAENQEEDVNVSRPRYPRVMVPQRGQRRQHRAGGSKHQQSSIPDDTIPGHFQRVDPDKVEDHEKPEGNPKRVKKPKSKRANKVLLRLPILPSVFTLEECSDFRKCVIQFKKLPAVSDDETLNHLEEIYKGHDPYEVALKLLLLASCMKVEPSVYKSILTVSCKVVKNFEDACAPDLQEKALVFTHSSVLKPFAEDMHGLFNVGNLSIKHVENAIKIMIKYHMYEAAMEVAQFNAIEHRYTPEDFVIPLLLRGKFKQLGSLLQQSSHFLEPALSFLDGLLARSHEDFKVEIQKFEVPEMKLKRHTIVLKVIDWQKTLGFDMRLCPQVTLACGKLQLIKLVTRFLHRKNLPYVNWCEMVEEFVAGNPLMAKLLVTELLQNGAVDEAKHWADKKGVELPEVVADGSGNHGDGVTKRRVKEFEYLDLDVDMDKVQFVDSEDGCVKAFEELSKAGEVAFATERTPGVRWKPRNFPILQLATASQVFIFDVPKLLKSSAFHEGLDNMFVSKTKIIGYNFKSKVSTLKKMVGASKQWGGKNVLDLKHLTGFFVNKNSDTNAPEDVGEQKPKLKSRFRGLRELTEAVLGKALNSSEEYSNWDNRPLRDSQMLFAVREVSVLLRIYETAGIEAEKLGKTYSDLVVPHSPRKKSVDEKAPAESKKKLRKKMKKPLDEALNSDDRHVEEILVDGKIPDIMANTKKKTDIKFVIDRALHRLSRFMIKGGCDVISFANRGGEEPIPEEWIKENRVILTDKRGFKNLKDRVPPGYCYGIRNKKLFYQVTEVCKTYSISDLDSYKKDSKEQPE
ncbi:unnamed protein product [Notodromas monacha]|uniref:3'-5' exonuclease domain-containing protein n=1 Tax=Notodromas monacha TaxID=399045 RepID=A0A7R9BUT8_9CRUS|nr:unnamed protein product [Notodromas monacha]CAG0921115.1 unnamed protein product [Notodromas monacha]